MENSYLSFMAVSQAERDRERARERECEGESCGIYIYACLGGAKPKLLSHIHFMHLTAQIVNLTWHFQAEIRNAPAFKLAPICK